MIVSGSIECELQMVTAYNERAVIGADLELWF
jgi:hypothetical protein